MYIHGATIKDAGVFEKVAGFEWDEGNKGKNWDKHKVRDEECEELFFDHDKKILKDILHSGKEKRYIIIGKTKKQRPLFAAFTIRKDKVRIISARDLNKKEYKYYEEEV
jgi:uncharacterized DUF497 family protein